ncbi:MAG: Nif3-like dinuclear metal center hexameric protein [Eggerthellaceae bacterium]|nr:Nif3-like dinuclear metal center hexameric protein [Eggerthellaceae bacterium]
MGFFSNRIKGLAKRSSTSIVPKKETIDTVGALEQALLANFPAQDAEEWDKTGLIVGDRSEHIEGIAVALDPTLAAVKAAASAQANVLVTHHPLFIEPPSAFGPAEEGQIDAGPVVWQAIRDGIAIMSFHTALDSSVLGNHMLPKMLSLEVTGLIHALEDDETKGYGTLCAFSKREDGMTLGQLGARCLSVFGRPPRVWGDFSTKLHTVATCNGSANSIVGECAASGIDCLVCGEIGYHHALELSQAGICVIELGHDVSELPFIATLAATIEHIGVDKKRITLLDQSTNWSNPESIRI